MFLGVDLETEELLALPKPQQLLKLFAEEESEVGESGANLLLSTDLTGHINPIMNTVLRLCQQIQKCFFKKVEQYHLEGMWIGLPFSLAPSNEKAGLTTQQFQSISILMLSLLSRSLQLN